jgi:hypothetical protein
MKKRILMVFPEIPISYWSFKYIMKRQARKKYRYLNSDFRAYSESVIDYFDSRIDGIIIDLESRCGNGE